MIVFAVCMIVCGLIPGFFIGYVIGAKNMKTDFERFTSLLKN